MERNDMLILFLIIILAVMLYFEKYGMEHFGELDENNFKFNDNLNIGLGVTSSQFGNAVTSVNPPNPQNPDYNNLSQIPKLVLDSGNGYFQNRIKIVDNPNSPLLQLYEKNQNDVYNKIKNCDFQQIQTETEKSKILGFNNFNYNGISDDDSYAKITSLGKDLLTPFVSYPIGYSDKTTKP
jgi:hypothetical protein